MSHEEAVYCSLKSCVSWKLALPDPPPVAGRYTLPLVICQRPRGVEDRAGTNFSVPGYLSRSLPAADDHRRPAPLCNRRYILQLSLAQV